MKLKTTSNKNRQRLKTLKLMMKTQALNKMRLNKMINQRTQNKKAFKILWKSKLKII